MRGRAPGAALGRQVPDDVQLISDRVQADARGDLVGHLRPEVVALQLLAEKIGRRQQLVLIVVVGVAAESRVERASLLLRRAERLRRAHLREANVGRVLQRDAHRLGEIDALRVESHHRRLARIAGLSRRHAGLRLRERALRRGGRGRNQQDDPDRLDGLRGAYHCASS